jgi:hypothetical protein
MARLQVMEQKYLPPATRARFETLLVDTALPDPMPLDRTVTIFFEIAEQRIARGIYQVTAGFDGDYFLEVYREIQSPARICSRSRLGLDGSVRYLSAVAAECA